MKKILENLFLAVATFLVMLFLSIDLDSLNEAQGMIVILSAGLIVLLIWYVSRFFNDNLNNKA